MALFSGQTALAAVVVALGGDDSSSGTEQKPLATLAAARNAVRRLRKEGNRGPVEVLVKPGVYHLTSLSF